MSEDSIPTVAASDGGSTAGPADEATIRRLHRVVRLLDDGFRLPVVGIRVGIDPVLGLIPVVGDALPALFGLYVVLESARLGVSRLTLARMCLNIAIDWAVGSVPVLGDLFDVAFRCHRRNLDLALADLDATLGDGD